MLRLLTLSALVSISACSDSEAPGPSETPPLVPTQNDASYQTAGLREWAIIGNDVDDGNESFELTITAPAGTDYVDGWLADGPGFRFSKQGGAWMASVDLSALAPGEYQLLLAANGDDTAFAKHDFKRSHPLYVILGTDWDNGDPLDASLALQDELHTEHSELKISHFVGPYTFTDPTVTPERQTLLANWLISGRDNFQDEIGVHIHPYCNFVDQVGTILEGPEVECLTEPSVVYSGGDSTGYTVVVSSYSVEDFTRMLLATDALFEANGLGKPTSFRAGAWTAELNTLQSLLAADYIVDSSAWNWARLEEWDGGIGSGTFYDWNKEHWSSIGDTSQPYYPSTDDILETGASIVGILEIPGNGNIVDYVETSEMIEIFDKNWDRSLLQAPVSYAIGYHPGNLTQAYKTRITQALDHVDQYLASQDKGPVIYGTVTDMAQVWKRPE